MAEVTFKRYGVRQACYGCQRKLTTTEIRWFVGWPKRAVYGYCCWDKAAG